MKIIVDGIKSIIGREHYYPAVEVELDCELDDILNQFSPFTVLNNLEEDDIYDYINPPGCISYYGVEAVLDAIPKEDIEKYLKERE